MMDRTTRAALLAMSGLVLLFPEGALGAEHGESPGLFTGDLGNIIWTLLTFLAVVFVLGKFAWRPILKALQSREEFIAKSIRDADEANKKAQQQFARYTEQLDKARAEAGAIVEEGRRDAEVVKREIHEKSRQEADAMIERARREVGVARDSAVRELYDLGARLATDVAGKIIAKELRPADHQRLIEESIAELGEVEAKNN